MSETWHQDSDAMHRLGACIATHVGATEVEILSATRLAGGAIQDTWRLDLAIAGGPRTGRHTWVMRADAQSRLPLGLDRTAEFEVIRAAHRSGVRVAEPIVAVAAGQSPVGAAFLLGEWADGSAQARRLVRDPHLPEFGDDLAAVLARQLASIHAIRPPIDGLACLPIPALSPARMEVQRLRSALDRASDPRPALEYVLAWLDRHAPPSRALSLVHGDFRTGNFMIDGGRLTGILDWEFAHWGDADEDLGWFTARCWRFGNDDREAGGIASLGSMLAAYEAASSRRVEPEAIAYWQIMAAARWAVIAVLQGDRFRRGGEHTLELALTGLMPPEMEHDALSAILAWSGQPAGGPTWR
jgi:aminoglycoside phosphotransferase (APT) family kinase protein